MILLLAACEQNDEPTIQTDIPFRADGILDFVRPDGAVITTIAIEIAATDSARTRGLMQRRMLPARGGMLFVFPDAEPRGFWMKNTPLPLDILFIAADSQVVNIARRTRPLSEDMIRSTGPAQYVLEVRSGFTDRYGITDSTRVRWRRTP
jgi:uncharacterized membrane protein (UPF0127 family)